MQTCQTHAAIIHPSPRSQLRTQHVATTSAGENRERRRNLSVVRLAHQAEGAVDSNDKYNNQRDEQREAKNSTKQYNKSPAPVISMIPEPARPTKRGVVAKRAFTFGTELHGHQEIEDLLGKQLRSIRLLSLP